MGSPIVISIFAESREAVKGFQDTANAAQAMDGRVSKTFKRLAAGFAATTVAAGVVAAKIGKDAVVAASDMNETLSKSSTIFGKNNATILKWASTAATSLGMSRQEAIAGAAQFGNFFDQIGIGGRQAAKMSTTLVNLSTDLASFNNASPVDVMEAMQSATRGEYDALQAYVPTVNAAKVETEALAQTHKKSAKQLTDAEKATALFTVITRGAGAAQGDFAKTSGGLANQQRIMKARLEDTKVTLGQALLPGFTILAGTITKTVLPAFDKIITEHGPALTQIFTKIAGFVATLATTLAQGNLGAGGSQFGAIAADAKKVIPSFQEFGAAISNALSSLPSMTDMVNVFAAGMAFLADHLDEIRAAMPLIIAVFVAYKVSQLAANAAAAASIPLRLLEVASTRSLVSAMNAHTAALNANTIAMGGQVGGQQKSLIMRIKERLETIKTNIALRIEQINRRGGIQVILAENLARAKNLVATAASNAAMKAQAAWTKIVTAAQWLWNAAMSANPIGIIIIAIIALIAGLVLLYKNSSTARKIMQAAWEGIKAAAVAVFNFLVGFFKATFNVIATVFKWVVARLKSAWAGIQALAAIAVAVFGRIRGAVSAVVSWVVSQFQAAVSRAKAVWNGILGIVSIVFQLRDRIIGAISGIASRFYSIGSDIVSGLRDGISGAWGRVTSMVQSLVNKIPKAIRDVLLSRSPSKVTMSIGQDIVEGLRLGLHSGVKDIQRESKALARTVETTIGAAAPTVHLATLATGAAAGAGAGTVIQVTVNVPPVSDPIAVGRAIERVLRAYETGTGRTVLQPVGMGIG